MLMPVILSGGAGTRLWPVSREAYPKPFMRVGDQESLLQKALLRGLAARDVPAGAASAHEGVPCAIVTNKEYYFLTRDEIATLVAPAAGATAASGSADLTLRPTLLLEPAGRNTAPAIALAALWAEATHGAATELLVLPADQLVRDLEGFCAAARTARALARQGRIALFGIQPAVPETGFGYIELGAALPEARSFRVARFVEKPALDKAMEYVASGRHVWNSGMFCFRADTILAALAAHAPDVLAAARLAWQAVRQDGNATDRIDFDAASFAAMPAISIDYAVMEKADNIAVVTCDFGWSDVGSWKSYSEQLPADPDGNTTVGDALLIDAHHCHVQADKRLVAAVGVDNLVVVDTPDALLVASRERAQDVRAVVEHLKERGHESIRLHQTTARPWGTYTVLEEGPRFKIKRIEVKPGQSLSLQLHEHRSEHWVVVSGRASVTNGESEFAVEANESTFIPARVRHRLENRTNEPLVIIEVQCGNYLGEDDIVRFSDLYQRA